MVGRSEEQYLRQLTERDKREYTSRSTAGSYADGASLMSDGAARPLPRPIHPTPTATAFGRSTS